MPAPKLRHHKAFNGASTAATTLFTVPPDRALVGRLVVAGIAASTVTVQIGGDGLVQGLPLAAGETYEQAGVVIPAGSSLVYTVSAANAAVIHFFGEEVDN